MLNEVHQEGGNILGMPEDHDQSFDVIRAKYINLSSIRSVLFTELESNTSQRQTKITYKINSGADENLMPFKIFKCLFPKSK